MIAKDAAIIAFSAVGLPYAAVIINNYAKFFVGDFKNPIISNETVYETDEYVQGMSVEDAREYIKKHY